MAIDCEACVAVCHHPGSHMSQKEAPAVSVRKAVTGHDIYALGTWHIYVYFLDGTQEASGLIWPLSFPFYLSCLSILSETHCD